MKKRIYLSSKNGKYNAIGIYEEGRIDVLPGTRINCDFSKTLRAAEIVLRYRNNSEYVDEEGLVLKNCSFTGASTAAQFVTGRSTNGLLVWEIEPKVNLKLWLSQHPEEAIKYRKKKEPEPQKPKESKALKNERNILSLLTDNPSLTVEGMAKIAGLSTNGVWGIIKRLKKKNAIKRVGSKRKGHWAIISN